MRRDFATESFDHHKFVILLQTMPPGATIFRLPMRVPGPPSTLGPIWAKPGLRAHRA
jgi:hypothetical protein